MNHNTHRRHVSDTVKGLWTRWVYGMSGEVDGDIIELLKKRLYKKIPRKVFKNQFDKINIEMYKHEFHIHLLSNNKSETIIYQERFGDPLISGSSILNKKFELIPFTSSSEARQPISVNPKDIKIKPMKGKWII